MKVICIKLSSGEELIARREGDEILTEGDPRTIFSITNSVFQDVHVVQLTPVREGMAIQFIPWAMGAMNHGRAPVKINPAHITAVYEADADMEKGFLKQISGIEIATAAEAPGPRIIM